VGTDVEAAWCLAPQRQRLIADYVYAREWVTVAELARAFRISAATVRRDLSELERRRRVVRVHGGAGASGVVRPRVLPPTEARG
jgi:DeoR/GlpR family transcriptional regulator of sugar metabolism